MAPTAVGMRRSSYSGRVARVASGSEERIAERPESVSRLRRLSSARISEACW